VAGVFLIIPLLASNAIALSYMSLKGIGISVSTLPVITVGLGVGIDFGIYLYSRYIEEYKARNDLEQAVFVGNYTAGKGVFFTAVTLILPVALWYLISGIKFQGEMGLFLSILLGVNLIACLIFHPAITTLIKPRFVVQPSEGKTDEGSA
jgi:predicted RND superfamily exporter protein